MMQSEIKKNLRLKLAQIRSSLGEKRRQEASFSLYEKLKDRLQDHLRILSFASFGTEIDIWKFNAALASEKKLVLPKIHGMKLQLYQVDSFDDLQRGAFNILEPKAFKCKPISLQDIDCILVPGLGFDKAHMRIGYGNGHYDRLLKSYHGSKMGVGFGEQLVDTLPIEEHDEKLDALVLV